MASALQREYMSNPNWQRFRTKIRKAQRGMNRSVIAVLIIILSVTFVVIGYTTISSTPMPAPTGQSTPIDITAHRGAKPTASASSSPSTMTYISISGQNFIDHHTRIHPYGSTMYPYWTYNGAIHRGGSWTRTTFKSYIDQILSVAQQAHLNTIRTTNYFDGITYGDWYNATVWSNMDYLFQQAERHNIHVLLDLSSFRDKTLKQGIYPYDPSMYTAAFSWVASRYANNPALLNYAIAGEVKCPTSSDPLRPTSAQALTNYYRVLSNTLYAADPHHLISSGGLSYLNESGCGIDWKSIFSLPHINMAAIHVYSDGDRTVSMPMVAGWAASNLKPFTVEEFGFKQGDGDATRASEFQNMYNLGKQYNATTMIFWNLGPEVGSTSYEVGPNTPLTWNTIIHNAPQ